MIKYAEWDSRFFKSKTGVVEFSSSTCITESIWLTMKKEALENQYNILYIKTLHGNAINEEILNRNKEHLLFVDRKVIYIKSICQSDFMSNPFIRDYEINENPSELYTLAFESGKNSRFKHDIHFPVGTFERLYRLWVNRSVRREIADNVLVYDNQQISGFLTYKIEKGVCIIGLVAVSPLCQGLGIGTSLIKYLEQQMFIKNISTVVVATQGVNSQACHFYEKNNFQVKNTTNIYHLWL